MIGLDVLSVPRGKGITGSEGSPSGQEKDSAENDLSADFAGIFQQWLMPLNGLKEQDCGEETSGGAHKHAGLQKLFAGLLEKSQLETSFQDFFPAGKEENSGMPASLKNGLGQRLTEIELLKFRPWDTEQNFRQSGIMSPKFAENNNIAAPETAEYKTIIDLLEKLSGEMQAMPPAAAKSGIGLRPALLQTDSLAGKADTAAYPAEIAVTGNDITGSDHENVPETVRNIRGFPAEAGSGKNSAGQEGSGKDNLLFSAAHNHETIENSEVLLNENILGRSVAESAAAQNKTDNFPAAAGTAKVTVWEQIAAGIQRNVVSSHQEIRGFELQLYPENLGKIKLHLRWESGQVHIQCQAAEAVTLDLLQQNLGQLRESLQESGISCGMMQMGLGEQPKEKKPKEELKLQLQTMSESEEPESLLQTAAYGVSKSSGGYQINLTA